MGRQRKNLQSKGMEDSPLKEVNNIEASKLSDRIQKSRYKDSQETHIQLQGLSENYSSMKMTETINKNQLKMKDTISSMKNTLKAIKRRLDESEDQIHKLEDKVEKNTHREQQKEKRLRKNE